MIEKLDKDGDKKLSRTEFIAAYEYILNFFVRIFYFSLDAMKTNVLLRCSLQNFEQCP